LTLRVVPAQYLGYTAKKFLA